MREWHGEVLRHNITVGDVLRRWWWRVRGEWEREARGWMVLRAVVEGW